MINVLVCAPVYRWVPTKKEYYANQVLGCLEDQGSIFSIINTLLHKSSAFPLPEHNSPSSRAQDFAEFFDSKIKKIYHDLNSISANDQDINPAILKISKKSPSMFCPQDPIPSSVFEEVYHPLFSILPALVNLSLETRIVACDMKEALINPISKEPHLGKDALSNYRLVSNLTYISKLIE